MTYDPRLENARWVGLTVSLPVKWELFLKHLADDHNIDLNTVLGELCEWAFSDPEGKEQFRVWLDEAYPRKGEVEEEARAAGEEAAEEEEECKEELKRNPTNIGNEITARKAIRQSNY